MLKKARLWIARNYKNIVSSIAFYPALIAVLFLILSFLLITLDFSATGKDIKASVHWLRLRDATTARSIISSITSGIISLAVFSFTMVMIILNQTASQMSNRILNELIGNRFQQVVLGTYIGTIVFALFLLSTIRDIDSGIYIPALSTYFLIILTIVDIFLFIYFLHYITQSVKYEVIINRIFNETLHSMKRCSKPLQKNDAITFPGNASFIQADINGVYEGFNKNALLQICEKNDCVFYALRKRGEFIFAGMNVLQASHQLPEEVLQNAANTLYLHNNETIHNNFFYGFRQLTEVAVKALSPGINDPATAVQSLRALTKLFIYRLDREPVNVIRNDEGTIRIITMELEVGQMFQDTFYPIWDYGKNDRIVLKELNTILGFILSKGEIRPAIKLYENVKKAMLSMEI